MLSKYRAAKRQGFTLIELLVIITIIAILAAILFSVFQKVRENACRPLCQSNEKQIGLAFIQHTQDADGGIGSFKPSIMRPDAWGLLRSRAVEFPPGLYDIRMAQTS